MMNSIQVKSWTLRIALMAVILPACVEAEAQSTFTVQPVSVIQAEGLEAVFECHYPGVGVIHYLIVNGTNMDADIPMEDSPAILSIPATPEYNNTVVQCGTLKEGEGTQARFVHSNNVTLTVQGPLESVSQLDASSMVSSINISWTPPFSLNLTTAEPDIVYCVDVYIVTVGETELVETKCDINDTFYLFSPDNPSPDHIFNITVTPVSNVAGSQNGTRSQPIQASTSLCTAQSTFTLQPVSVTQAEGLEAVFECRYPGVDVNHVLIINGTNVDATVPMRNFPAVFIITAAPEYNNTVVQCRALMEGEGTPAQFIYSNNVTLTVQGPLESVSHLDVSSTVSAINISWTPPFSLNLTTAEHDIIYCIDIYNVTGRELVETKCDINDTFYLFSPDNPSPDYIFNIIVTPVSNVAGSQNGTRSQPVQAFTSLYIESTPTVLDTTQATEESNVSGVVIDTVLLLKPLKEVMLLLLSVL